MKKPIYVLNGPNLNRLGRRQPEIYGHTTLAEVEVLCRAAVPEREIVFRQSNREYELAGAGLCNQASQLDRGLVWRLPSAPSNAGSAPVLKRRSRRSANNPSAS
jgi:hypothetical protein